MESNYEKVKDFAKKCLINEYKAKNGILERDSIKTQVDRTKELSKNEVFAQSLGLTQPITDNDYEQLIKDLETLFNVKMLNGVVIQGDEQRKRDTSWWGKLKLDLQKENKDYYTARFKKYIEETIPPKVIQMLDDDTDFVMNNIGNPDEDEFDIRGMVVGHVQSGKTLNYASLICKAADAGYKFIVIIAGDKNILRNQTQERINAYFSGKEENNFVRVIFSEQEMSKLPISLTTQKNDFNKKVADANAQGVNFDNIKSPLAMVIKKNAHILDNVIKWLKNQSPNTIMHPMLVIDDEADYASVNTKPDNDPTKINALIRQLLRRFKKRAYVAYTATPFANIFINDDTDVKDELAKDLFPSDFIYALDTPTNYFGAQKIFLDENTNFVVEIDDFAGKIPFKHSKNFEIKDLPLSLYEALNRFCLNCAIRHLRGQTGHNSMLVHTSRFVDVQKQIYFKITRYLNKVKKELKAYEKLDDATKQSEIIRAFYALLATQFAVEFSAKDIISKLKDIIYSIVVKEENNKSTNRIEYYSDRTTNVIAVGGAVLSRGFTLEGLSVSYFIRNSIFYDTLMQMGRWFGYRDGYEDLCKIYMPSAVRNNFVQITEAINELMDRFKDMASENKTPSDFGLAVKRYPDSLLQITARNKMRHAETIQMTTDFRGLLRETAVIHKNVEILNKNFETLKNFVNKHTSRFYKKGHIFLAKDIEKNEVLSFLERFLFVHKYSNLMPIEIIKKYVKEKNTAWDVALYNVGEGKEFTFNEAITVKSLHRTLRETENFFEINKGKILSTNLVKYALDENVVNDKDIRKKLNNPLLMLHVTQIKGFKEKVKEELSELKKGMLVATFGVCFPDSKDYQSQSIDYALNSVAIKQMLEENDFDEMNEGDDDE